MKHKKTWLISIIVLFIIGVAIFIFTSTDDGIGHKYNIDLYFFNEQHTSIVKENRDVTYRYKSELPKVVLEALIKGPNTSKRNKIINSSTKVNSIEHSDDGLIVDFSAEYLSDNSAQDILTTYAVVKTLCNVDTVTQVKVTIDGKEISSPNGTTLGFLSSNDINLPTDTISDETSEIALYFADSQAMYLTKEMRTIKIADKQPLEQYIVNELIKGPANSSSLPVLSSDTVVISVESKDGICFVNLKSNFLDKNAGGSAKENFAIYSIVNSLTELPDIHSVQFLINGKKAESFGQFGFSEPFTRNDTIMGIEE